MTAPSRAHAHTRPRPRARWTLNFDNFRAQAIL